MFEPGKMTAIDTVYLRDQAGDKLRCFLRQHVPSCKDLVRSLERRGVVVAKRTADEWYQGKLPENKHLLALFSMFGPRFAAFILEPCGAWAREWEVQARLADVERELRSIRAELGKDAA